MGGIARRPAARRQNRRVGNAWRRTHLVSALTDKAAVAVSAARIGQCLKRRLKGHYHGITRERRWSN
jgi:hypothetical protein